MVIKNGDNLLQFPENRHDDGGDGGG